MTSGEQRVMRLRRPPVRQATTVRSDIDHTFAVFVRTMGLWWPRAFSAGGDRMREVTLERWFGGRVYETWADGTVVDWGELIDWQPPHRFTITWRGTPAPTEVELTFGVLGPALTRVAVEHRGWEALSDEQLSQDCALPGGYHGGAYQAGWTTILAAFADAVEAALLGSEQ